MQVFRSFRFWALLTILLNTLSRYAGNHAFYYNGQAMSYLTLLIAVPYYNSKCEGDKKMKELAVWLAINNALDEAVFDPTAIQLNEYIFAIFITLWIFREPIKTLISKWSHSPAKKNL